MMKFETYAIHFKANKDRGEYNRNVSIDGLLIDSAMTAVIFTKNYDSHRGGKSPSEFK